MPQREAERFIKFDRKLDKMGTKRYKGQILSHVLQICQGDNTRKTKVVYASGLNFKIVEPSHAFANLRSRVYHFFPEKDISK